MWRNSIATSCCYSASPISSGMQTPTLTPTTHNYDAKYIVVYCSIATIVTTVCVCMSAKVSQSLLCNICAMEHPLKYILSCCFVVTNCMSEIELYYRHSFWMGW